MPINSPQTRSQKIIKKLFGDLESAGLLIKKPPIPDRRKKILQRMLASNLTLQAYEKITDNKKWDEFAAANVGWFDEAQLDVIFSNLSVFYVLDMLEGVKQMFQLVLNHDMTYNGCRFKESGTLGQYLAKFSRMFKNAEYREVVDNRFRSAVAHSLWWYENNHFCYEDRGVVIRLDLSSFAEKHHEVNDVIVAMISELDRRKISVTGHAG